MRLFRVEVSVEAAEDLIMIWESIGAHNPDAADRYLHKIDDRIDSLVEMPARGVPRDDLSAGLRMLVEGNHLIFYRIENDHVKITRVLHGSQDIARVIGEISPPSSN